MTLNRVTLAPTPKCREPERKGWATRARCALMGLSVSVTLAGCGSSGPYVWVNDTQVAAETSRSMIIVPGDTLAITVYNDERVSGPARVRSDGMISVLLVGEVQAAGKTPLTLAQELQTGLAKFLNAPTVAVRVEQEAEISVSVLGEINQSGIIKLERGSGMLQALALAGGLTDYADEDSIFVIRQNPRVRIRFSYDDLIANDERAVTFKLMSGDVVYVD